MRSKRPLPRWFVGSLTESLTPQSGPMSDTEADAFETHPHVNWAISFRKHGN
jgi:hypothetical protein